MDSFHTIDTDIDGVWEENCEKGSQDHGQTLPPHAPLLDWASEHTQDFIGNPFYLWQQDPFRSVGDLYQSLTFKNIQSIYKLKSYKFYLEQNDNLNRSSFAAILLHSF